jgi:uncharacterized repeat protein (TIGR01451 family)
MVALLGGLFVPATPAFALSGSHEADPQADGPGSYSARTGEMGAGAGSGYSIPHQQATTLEVAIISTPWAPVDHNGVPGTLDGDIPRVYVVEAAVRNAGSTTATDVVVTLTYNPTGDWVLLAGEDPVRRVDELAPGETYYAYWFAGYPPSHLDLPGSHQYSVTASAANASEASTSQNSYEPDPGWTVQTRSTQSTGNSGVTQTIADIVVGVELSIIQDFDLGTNPGDITFSPVGNDDFDPRAYRLQTVQVRFFDDENTQEVTFNDRLYFPESDVPGFADQAEVTYTLLPVLLVNTTLCPYTVINYSSNAKYDLNFCSDSIGTQLPISGTLTLSMTKAVSSQTIEQGQLLTYTIDYANTGDVPLQYTWVWDEVPTGVSIVSSSIDPASDPDETTGSRVAWDLGPIPQAGQSGSSDTLTFSVLVDGDGQDLPDGTSLVNYAFFGISPGGLPQRAALTSTVTTEVRAPTVSITKTDGRDSVGPNELLTYDVRVTNGGASSVTGAVITDVLPADVTLAGSVTPSPDGGDDQTLVWNDVTIPSGNTFIATIPVRVAADAPEGRVLENTATVLYGNSAGHTYAQKTATDTTTVRVPVLTFTKTAEDVDGPPLVVGDQILYTLQVTNIGTYAAHNVVVTDDLPDGVTYVDASADKGTVGESNGTVNWTIPELAAQSDNVAILVITVTLDDGTEGQTIVNTGSVTGDNVPNPPDDPTPVCPDGRHPNPVSGECPNAPDPRDTELAFTKTAEDLNGPPVGVGDAILYTLQVTNTGTYTAYNVVVTDDLPGLVTCQAVSGDNAPGGCADPLVWTIPSLAQGATASLYITVTIDEAALGESIINTASVIGDNVPNPPDPPTPVCPDGSPSVGGVCPNIPVPGTSLALSKTAEDVDGPPLLVGDTIRYTLQVTNTGTYTAFNVIVTDDLPDQVTCRDVWGDNAPAVCADPLVWSIPSLAPDATASLYIDVFINFGSEGQSIINTASVIGGNVANPPDPPTPVCPDGSLPVDGVCPNVPGPGPSTSLALSKTSEDVDGPPLLVGDTLRYTLQVTNTGTYTAFNVIVTDDLPDQVTCRDVWGDNAPAGCADPLVWTIPSLAPDATASLYIDVTINLGSEGQSIINTASVFGGNVPNPPDPPTPVCPDGRPPADGICEFTPEPAPGSGIFLPLILKNSK